MSVHIVDDEQRRDRPQCPCARRVAAEGTRQLAAPGLELALRPRAHLRCWPPSTMPSRIACGRPPSICARGARNAAPCNSRTGS